MELILELNKMPQTSLIEETEEQQQSSLTLFDEEQALGHETSNSLPSPNESSIMPPNTHSQDNIWNQISLVDRLQEISSAMQQLDHKAVSSSRNAQNS
jgi:hypothetical protein